MRVTTREYSDAMTEIRLQIQGQRGAITAETLISMLQYTLGVLREVDRTSRGENDTRASGE